MFMTKKARMEEHHAKYEALSKTVKKLLRLKQRRARNFPGATK